MQFKEIMLNKSKFHRDKKNSSTTTVHIKHASGIFLDNEEVI
jgi:hypothetical protein